MNTVSAILSTLIAATFTIFLAILGSWLQNRSWLRQNYTTNREDARKEAINTLSRLTEIVSKRIYRQKRYARSIILGDKERLSISRIEYEESLFDWNDSFGSIKLGLRHYFGLGASVHFENELMRQLVKNGSKLESLDKKGLRTGAATLEHELSVIADEFSWFTERLLSRANQYEIAGAIPEGEISHRNAANLTIPFLVFRLFRNPRAT